MLHLPFNYNILQRCYRFEREDTRQIKAQRTDTWSCHFGNRVANTPLKHSMPSHRVPRRSTRCARIASEKGRLGAARGGTGLHCFSRRGNLLSALFTRVSSFSLHYHYTTSITTTIVTAASRHHYNRLVSSSAARYFYRVLRLFGHPRIDPSSVNERRYATPLCFRLYPSSTDN